MIGKPEWFMRRKYGGWGLVPKTWQGYLYIGIAIIPIIALQFLFNGIDSRIKLIITVIWALLLIADTLHIMANLKKDERETIHEAIAERNAMWFMIIALCMGAAYESAMHFARYNEPYINPIIAVAVLGALAVKAGTNYWLEKHS